MKIKIHKLIISLAFIAQLGCDKEVSLSENKSPKGNISEEDLEKGSQKVISAESSGKTAESFESKNLDEIKKVVGVSPNSKHSISETTLGAALEKPLITPAAKTENEEIVGSSSDDTNSETETKMDTDTDIKSEVTVVSPFHVGMIGCKGLTFNGNSTLDSYNSTNSEDSDTYLGNGNLITYGEESNIVLSGNTTVNGNVNAFGASSDIILSENASINSEDDESTEHVIRATGKIETSENAEYGGKFSTDVPPLKLTNNCDPIGLDALFERATSSLETETAYLVEDNDETTLKPGTYSYESFKITDNAVLDLSEAGDYIFHAAEGFEISGNAEFLIGKDSRVTVYVAGKVMINGNGLSNESPPENLIIFSNFEDENGILLGGNSDFNGIIYAPRTGVTLTDNTTYRGAIRGLTIKNDGNLDFYFDETLQEIISIRK